MDFKQAENRFKQLKGQFEAGVLTETEFKTKLEDLMIQDQQGIWWIIGYETGRWYRHNGKSWVQADLPTTLSQKSRPAPTWTAIIWITLGWAIAGAIGWDFAGATGWKISWVITGAIGGFLTAATLHMEKVISDWKSLLWITLAWATASAIGWGIGGAIGGLVTAATLRMEKVISDWKSLLWITLAWAIGGTIGAAISGPLGALVGLEIGWTISAAIGGIIGGIVMVWQSKRG